MHRPEAAPAYTRAIEGAGQHAPVEPDTALSSPLDEFVTRVLALTDDERRGVADARRAVDEVFHERALAAAAELLVGRGEEYARARRAIGDAHLPRSLRADGADGEGSDLADIARHVQLAIDDGLLAVLTSDLLHPNHARELHRSLKGAFDTEGRGRKA